MLLLPSPPGGARGKQVQRCRELGDHGRAAEGHAQHPAGDLDPAGPRGDPGQHDRRLVAGATAAGVVGGGHWSLVTPVRTSELSEAEREEARSRSDIPLP